MKEILKENDIKQKDSVVIFGNTLPRDRDFDLNASLEELSELVTTAGGEVVAIAFQNIKRIESAMYIASGKAQEIKDLVEENEATLVVFNNELSGSQIRNLEEFIGVRVIDRTALILDIFAKRASSHIAKLQVELAQYKYMLPRLVGMRESLSRTGSGVGARGPGEQKLELDRRKIDEKIVDIKKRLEVSVKNREVTGRRRSKNNIPIVALVGYTNAGKSSIMNKFIDEFSGENDTSEEKKVFEKDMLFATLDTFHRKIDIDEHKSFILVDTVGFVDRLPHTLVDAFKSTLEEALDADLLLHIVDASHFTLENQFKTTDKLLKKLGAEENNIVRVFNKSDLLPVFPIDIKDYRADIYTSMKTSYGFSDLVKVVNDRIFGTLKEFSLLIPYTQGSDLNEVINISKVIEMEYLDNGTKVLIEVDPDKIQKYSKYIVEMEV